MRRLSLANIQIQNSQPTTSHSQVKIQDGAVFVATTSTLQNRDMKSLDMAPGAISLVPVQLMYFYCIGFIVGSLNLCQLFQGIDIPCNC